MARGAKTKDLGERIIDAWRPIAIVLTAIIVINIAVHFLVIRKTVEHFGRAEDILAQRRQDVLAGFRVDVVKFGNFPVGIGVHCTQRGFGLRHQRFELFLIVNVARNGPSVAAIGVDFISNCVTGVFLAA